MPPGLLNTVQKTVRRVPIAAEEFTIQQKVWVTSRALPVACPQTVGETKRIIFYLGALDKTARAS